MPRVKGSPQKCINPQQSNNSWLFLMKNDALEGNGESSAEIVKLRHPLTGQQSMFMFSADNSKVQEVLSFSEHKRSWVVNEHVKSDGKLHLSTPIDPLFLVLPYLHKSSGRFEPLEQLLTDAEYPDTSRLMNSIEKKQLSLIADSKGSDDETFLRYNEEKTLSWLERKVNKLADAILQKGLHVGPGAVSANFVRTDDNTTSNNESKDYIQYAFGIVAEYLPSQLNTNLRNHLSLPEETKETGVKRKVETTVKETETNVKKSRKEEKKENEETDEPPKTEKTVTKKSETAKDKALAKAATGTPSITSFFKKK